MVENNNNANISTNTLNPMPDKVVRVCTNLAIWFEQYGYRKWCVAGICDRRWAYECERLHELFENNHEDALAITIKALKDVLDDHFQEDGKHVADIASDALEKINKLNEKS